MSVRYHLTGSTAAEISASVEAGVREGKLAPGEALPPVRSLAAQLRVSPATVASAYRCLRERGLIETAGRRGTRIRPRPPVAGPRSSMPPPPGGVDLASGEPDPALLPDLGPHLRRLATTVGHASGYASAGPCPELVALARSVAWRLGAIVQDDQGVELDGERLVRLRQSLPDATEHGTA